MAPICIWCTTTTEMKKNIMSSFFDAVSSQAFIQNAIVGGILASVACGVVGSYVVVKRIGYLAGGIAHSV